MELTIGECIDRLITASHKCWHAQDKIMEPGLSDEEVAKYARMAQLANIDRSIMVHEIDKHFGQGREIDANKTYHQQ